MVRVTHFDLPADNPEELKKFYERVFDWNFDKWSDPTNTNDYWFINTGTDKHGINGGMAKKKDSSDQISNTISVSNIDHYIKRIEDNGGEILLQKMRLDNVGWLASFKDPQGNKFTLLQADKPSSVEEEKSKKRIKRYRHHAHDGIYSLGIIGAAIYYISAATGFWMGVLGLLKALVWPAFLVYEALKFMAQ